MARKIVFFLLATLAPWLCSQAHAGIFVFPWYNGVLNQQIGTDTDCQTQATETRATAYSGITYWPPQQSVQIPLHQLPAVNEVFYTHVVISHPGDPCFPSVVGVELILPQGVTTAVSSTNPAFCFARLPDALFSPDGHLDNLGTDPGYGCPQTYTHGVQGLALFAPNGGYMGSGAWGMANGDWLEFLIPLRSSSVQNGTNVVSFRINPDVSVVGYANTPLYVNGDTIFRAINEDQNVSLDICTVPPVATGC